MASYTPEDHDHTRHFEAWTNVQLAIHLHIPHDLHVFNVKEPDIFKLAKYSLAELEELHTLAHDSRLRDLEPMTDGRYEEALAVMNS